MKLSFSIHGIYTFQLTDPTERIESFIKEEFGYFKSENLSTINLEIRFVDKISLPTDHVYLLHNLIYDKDGCLYLITDDGILLVPVKDILKEK